MQMKNMISLKAGRLILPILLIGTVLKVSITTTGVSADDTLGSSVRVFELSTSDSNPITSLKYAVIMERASVDPNVDINDVDIARSTIDIDNFNFTKAGIQSVKVKVNLARKASEDVAYQDSVGYSFIEDAVIKVYADSAPKIALTSQSITVNNGDPFNPESFIIYATDDSGNLPALKIDSNVDMNVDGVYSVTYTAIDQIGNSASRSIEVTVKTPQEVLDAIAEEEARKQAEEEQKQSEEEERRRTVYSYFDSKQEILYAIMSEHLSSLEKEFETIIKDNDDFMIRWKQIFYAKLSFDRNCPMDVKLIQSTRSKDMQKNMMLEVSNILL